MKNPKPIKPYQPPHFEVALAQLVCSKCGYRFFGGAMTWQTAESRDLPETEKMIRKHVCKPDELCGGSGYVWSKDYTRSWNCPGCKDCSLPKPTYLVSKKVAPMTYEEAMVLAEHLEIDNQTFPDEIQIRPAPVPAGTQLVLFT